MHPVFKKLGIPPEVRAFFNLSKPVFSYGSVNEIFTETYHFVPTTATLWQAGSSFAKEVIICNSAVEAAAYLTIKRHSYQSFDNLLFLATGNLPHPAQIKWISRNLAKRKITLVLGNDILGRLCDVKIAAGIKNQTIRFRLVKSQIHRGFKGKQYTLPQDGFTLNAFEKISGLRSQCRTCKPKIHNSFLDQLKSYGHP